MPLNVKRRCECECECKTTKLALVLNGCDRHDWAVQKGARLAKLLSRKSEAHRDFQKNDGCRLRELRDALRHRRTVQLLFHDLG
jgi:SET domain-containing protein